MSTIPPTADPPSWKTLSEQAYRSAAEQLVHFSFKTVNSNARAGGIRLAPTAGLDLPYVAARTCLAAGATLALDYIKNSGSTATAIKQMRTPEGATVGELSLINELLGAARSSGLELGLEPIDARLRQVLIPHPDATGGYVSLTPVTAGGICERLFAAEGMVTTHNAQYQAAVKAGPGKTDRVQIRRAHLGIGGANPQNVGALVRSMQRPILAPSPRAQGDLRTAYRIFHGGIELPSLTRMVIELRQSRERNSIDTGVTSTMASRQREVELLLPICNAVMDAGNAALDVLISHAAQLPREHPMSDDTPDVFELLSRKVPPDLRGLIDPRLRGHNWLDQIASRILGQIEAVTIKVGLEQIPAYALDASGRSTTKGLLMGIIK